MNKILLAIQYWDGDKAQANRVARLITDIQPGRSEQADFLFAARYDCEHDMETVNYVSSKFNVHHFINHRRQAQGWPYGPNELWFGTMDWLYTQREANLIPEYKAVLTFEADSCPLTPNWIAELSQRWDEAKVNVFGALQHTPGPHINGNALFSMEPKFLQWVARGVGGCSPHQGWDYALAPHFEQRGWADCSAMRSFWGTRSMHPPAVDALAKDGVVFLHGVKDDSVIDHVRSTYVRR